MAHIPHPHKGTTYVTGPCPFRQKQRRGSLRTRSVASSSFSPLGGPLIYHAFPTAAYSYRHEFNHFYALCLPFMNPDRLMTPSSNATQAQSLSNPRLHNSGHSDQQGRAPAPGSQPSNYAEAKQQMSCCACVWPLLPMRAMYLPPHPTTPSSDCFSRLIADVSTRRQIHTSDHTDVVPSAHTVVRTPSGEAFSTFFRHGRFPADSVIYCTQRSCFVSFR